MVCYFLSFLLFTVGNKDDCPDLKVVETGDARRFSEQMGVQLFETSAKENLNIEEVSYLIWITRLIVQMLPAI